MAARRARGKGQADGVAQGVRGGGVQEPSGDVEDVKI